MTQVEGVLEPGRTPRRAGRECSRNVRDRRRVSQRENRKLRDVATDLVERAQKDERPTGVDSRHRSVRVVPGS